MPSPTYTSTGVASADIPSAIACMNDALASLQAQVAAANTNSLFGSAQTVVASALSQAQQIVAQLQLIRRGA